jgi:hypothetical protein
MASIMTRAQMLHEKLTLEQMQEKEIHLANANCWCKPKVEQVEGK